MKIKEIATLVGISVRTLHHYDKIGLLVPQKKQSGYREYSQEDLETLQQILFFKELGLSLKKIKEIINSPSFNKQKALKSQHKMLLEKRKSLDKMISTIEKTILYSKGEIKMSNQEMFEGFDFSNNPYEKEARKLWGNSTVEKSNAKLAKLSKFEKKEYSERFNAIYKKLAELRHLPANSKDAQDAIEEWYVFLNMIGFYSLEAFKNLGQMYVDDIRFTENIDKFGKGLAVFMRDAMSIYADTNKT